MDSIVFHRSPISYTMTSTFNRVSPDKNCQSSLESVPQPPIPFTAFFPLDPVMSHESTSHTGSVHCSVRLRRGCSGRNDSGRVGRGRGRGLLFQSFGLGSCFGGFQFFVRNESVFGRRSRCSCSIREESKLAQLGFGKREKREQEKRTRRISSFTRPVDL